MFNISIKDKEIGKRKAIRSLSGELVTIIVAKDFFFAFI